MPPSRNRDGLTQPRCNLNVQISFQIRSLLFIIEYLLDRSASASLATLSASLQHRRQYEMAEVVGVISAVVSLVGAAGKLYFQLNAIATDDAPEELKAVSIELSS